MSPKVLSKEAKKIQEHLVSYNFANMYEPTEVEQVRHFISKISEQYVRARYEDESNVDLLGVADQVRLNTDDIRAAYQRDQVSVDESLDIEDEFNNVDNRLNTHPIASETYDPDLVAEIIGSKPKNLRLKVEQRTDFRDTAEIVLSEISFALARLGSKHSIEAGELGSFLCTNEVRMSVDAQLSSTKSSEQVLKLSEIGQSLAFALRSSHLHGIEVSDIGEPYHPLEYKLICMIKTSSLRPKKYKKGQDKAKVFFKRYYDAYIEAGVMYSDYLRQIDKPLAEDLHSARRYDDDICEWLPTMQKRMAIEREYVLSAVNRVSVTRMHNLMRKK